MKPTIGNWYRIQGGDSFEVVAYDEDDGTIELQYFDGTVEEMDIEDWQAEQENGALEEVQAPAADPEFPSSVRWAVFLRQTGSHTETRTRQLPPAGHQYKQGCRSCPE